MRVVVLAVVLAAAGACARQVSGEEAIDRMLQAIGSERDRAGVRSLRTIAEGSGPNGLFVTTVSSIRPDSVYFHQQTGLGTTEIWSTPERTWGGSNREAYAELAPTARAFVRGHEFHLLLLDVRSRFSGFEVRGEDAVNGTACLRVSMADEAGSPASVCLGQDDWLPVEMVLHPPGADGALRIEFADWRLIDGVRYFHSFRLLEGADDVFTYDYVEISANSFGQAPDLPAPTLPRPPL